MDLNIPADFKNFLNSFDDGKLLIREKKEVADKYKTVYKGDKWKLFTDIINKTQSWENEEDLIRLENMVNVKDDALVTTISRSWDDHDYTEDMGDLEKKINSGTPLRMKGQENTSKTRELLGNYAPSKNVQQWQMVRGNKRNTPRNNMPSSTNVMDSTNNF